MRLIYRQLYTVLQFTWSFPVSASADGTVHNLNQYIEIRAADVVTNLGDDSINAVFNQKLGVIVSETQLEEFVSLISR